MKFKSLILFALATIVLMGGYFLTHPSYEKSIRAKYYYEIGEYQEAYDLAKEAFSIDLYNRMASTIMAQSLTSLKYVAYIEDAKKYMQELSKIANREYIEDADKAKIRTICEIMLGSYIKLAPSVVTDATLVESAKNYHDGFKKLLEKLNR